MKNIAVFFGGKTVEHDVSIVTGLQLIENAPKEINIVPVYISRDGNWFTGDILDVKKFKSFDEKAVGVTPVYMDGLASNKILFHAENKKAVCEIDVVIIAMHGLNGEDGTLQGMLELKDIPYASPGVVGSGVGMDKIIMKAAFAGLGLPVLPMVSFERYEWAEKQQEIVSKIEKQIGYPVIVKPANLGSSIGITMARDKKGLIAAIDVAVHFDKRILAEKAVTAIKEINCSVLGMGSRCEVSVTESPVSSGSGPLDFKDKYLKGDKTSAGMKSLSRMIPAPVPDKIIGQVEEFSKTVFSALDLKGVCRIDYIYDEKAKKLYVNEVNTIPGSFAFYLWEPKGVPYPKLISKLIEIAEKSAEEKRGNCFAYESAILDKAAIGAIVKK